MVDSSEQETFKKHRFHSYYIWVVLHEILGHGTGRFLSESPPGNFQFQSTEPTLESFDWEASRKLVLPRADMD